jgi:hypothetical protein
MDTTTSSFDLLMDLEARHEDVLRQLDELDKRVQKTLAEWQSYRSPGIEISPATSFAN